MFVFLLEVSGWNLNVVVWMCTDVEDGSECFER